MLSTLVVHQDRDKLNRIGNALASLNMNVVLSRSALSMFKHIWTRAPEILILSDTLPGVDSLEITRQLRSDRTLAGMLIMLLGTGNGGDQIIQALDAGADDCLSVEFDEAELAARVRALARRSEQFPARPQPPGPTTGPFEMMPDMLSVRLRGRTIPLTQTEYQLLDQLVQARGAVVPTADLQKAVWGPDANLHDTNLVRVYIGKLRKKIEPDPARPVYIRTVRSVGYHLDTSGPETRPQAEAASPAPLGGRAPTSAMEPSTGGM